MSQQFTDHKTGCGTLSLAPDGPEKFSMQIVCGIIQFSGVMQSTAATPDSHLTQSIAHMWSRQMTLLCLCVKDRDILRQGETPDTGFDCWAEK